jgi:Concanavalin A-like lectin/glucanases superfamily
MRKLDRGAVLLCALGILAALPAQAQPFGAWLTLAGNPQHGYVRIADAGDLNPAAAITIEAWVNVSDANGGNCSSIVGKGYLSGWWVGLCGTTLRSYLKGGGSARDGGVIPNGQWTHVAVTYDGAHRRHYVNGELVASFAETGPLPSNAAQMRIGSDVDWQFTPAGSIDEVRIWNVARTQAQIRSAINKHQASQAGLVDLWPLDGGAGAIGSHGGSVQGSGVTFWTFPVAISCGGPTATSLCLNDRFVVTARYRTGAPGAAEGQAHTVDCPNPASGLFWFFSADNWEIQVKSIDACSLNNRYWVFSAATTNVFYRMEVFDIRAGVNKVYFNYPGPPAPAVTDVQAFATCP